MNKRVKIVVCCHKKDIMAVCPPFMPLHVGKALHPELELGIPGDDTGDNISNKNASYCELTGIYWAWKHLTDTDIIGVCHYRRYFDFHRQCPDWYPQKTVPTSAFMQTDITLPESLVENLSDGTVFVPVARHYRCSIAQDYCNHHISDDLRTLENVVYELYPNDTSAFRSVMFQSNRLSPCNMFIMTRGDFSTYCNWLFSILGEVEKRTDISHYSPVQRRIYGYMGERLLNVYLHARGFKVRHLPILYFTEQHASGIPSRMAYLKESMKYDIGFQLQKPKRFINPNYPY